MNNEIIIRLANKTDVKKLSILYKTVYIQTYGTEGVSDEFANFITKQFSEDRIEQLILDGSNTIVVSAYKNNLVGVLEIEYDKRCPVGNLVAPELNKLYILDWFCSKGIGKSLLQEAEQMLRKKRVKEMWLWVLASNNRAVAFYEKHNYRHIGNASFKMETNTYDNKVMVKTLIP